MTADADSRGAGAGCGTPPQSTKVPRSRSSAEVAASASDSTGVTHASRPAKTCSHSARVRDGEDGRQPAGLLRPAGPVVLRPFAGVKPERVEQFAVELRFQGADGHEAAVGGAVGAVEVRRAVQQVLAPAVGPQAGREHAVQHGGERRDPVDHGGVDHLAAPGPPALVQGGEDAEGEVGAAAAEVGQQVQRRQRRRVRGTEREHAAGDRGVVDVVARLGRARGPDWPQPVARP